jgi:hypothetical protein
MEKRRKWRYSLPMLAVIALAVLLALPVTRWLLRTQLAMAFLPPKEYAWIMQALGIREEVPVDTPAVRAKLRAATESHSGQFDYELAMAVMMPGEKEKWDSRDVVAALRDLEERYSDASLYAHILRFGTMGEIRIGRNDEQALVADRPPQQKSSQYTSTPDETKLRMYLEVADKGIEQEPGNAFFYVMRSILRFGLRQDTLALEDLHSAAECPRYEDYVWHEADARFALTREAFGEQSALTDMAQTAGILFPHYAQLRACARVAIYRAIQTEQEGRTSQGIAIREDVMRLGSLMRREARSYIGTLVGIAITGIGRTRPGGEYLGEESESQAPYRSNDTDTEKRVEETAQRKLDVFYTFLNQNERSDLAGWTCHEYEAWSTRFFNRNSFRALPPCG